MLKIKTKLLSVNLFYFYDIPNKTVLLNVGFLPEDVFVYKRHFYQNKPSISKFLFNAMNLVFHKLKKATF